MKCTMNRIFQSKHCFQNASKYRPVILRSVMKIRYDFIRFQSTVPQKYQPAPSPVSQQKMGTQLEMDTGSTNDDELHDKHRARTKDTINNILNGEDPNLQNIKHPYSETIQKKREIKKETLSDYMMPHGIWTDEEVNSVKITHEPCEKIPDYLAYLTVQTLRYTWDITTGYLFATKLGIGSFGYQKWLLRVCYLETVAGVPGMMFGMVRHLNSLRRMERDHGWIHTLLAEAENERIHLLTFLKMYQPGKPFRYAVVGAQAIFSNYLFLAYIVSPRYCHRFVGYLEQEAVKTYTQLLQDIDDGKLPEFEKECDDLAKQYWQLKDGSTWRDVFLQVRMDETNHRDVNHTLAPLAPNASNPFRFSHGKHTAKN